MRENHVKRALQAGQVQIGTWIHTFGLPNVARVLATAGFDYVTIDMEHSAFSIQTVGEICLAARDAGMMPMVRAAGKDQHLISRPVDNGATAVLIPHVDTREQAENAVRAVKFPPRGIRGSQPPNPQSDFAAVNASDYMAKSNEETMVLVQIESEESLANLDAILGVPGVDGVTIGRGDLSAELGITTGRDHPTLLQAVTDVIAGCQRSGKIPGLLVQDPEEAKEWIAKGVRMVTYAGDSTILRNASAAALKEMRSVL